MRSNRRFNFCLTDKRPPLTKDSLRSARLSATSVLKICLPVRVPAGQTRRCSCSSHAAGFFISVGTYSLWVIAATVQTAADRGVAFSANLVAALVAFSRLYLFVRFPTDVRRQCFSVTVSELLSGNSVEFYRTEYFVFCGDNRVIIW